MSERSILTTIDLLRHGEPVGGKKYRGQLDDPLSEIGWQQMRSAVADHCPWDRVVTSTLCRCQDFARELAERYALPLHCEPRLMEIGFGEWEGRTAEELMADDSESLLRFWSDPLNNTPPGAETLEAFEQRITAVWNDILQQYPGQHLLLVGHAGMIRMIMRHVLGMPLDNMFRLRVELAGITRIEVENRGERRLSRLLFHGGRL